MKKQFSAAMMIIVMLASPVMAQGVGKQEFEAKVFDVQADKPLQLAELSKQEMKETEGAAIWFAPAIAAGARFALTGFTRHGLNQAISRGGVGVSNRAILSTMRNPTKITTQSGGRTRFTGPNGGVVLNNQGKVITTWGKPR
ncbi:wall-associated protein precursor [Neisseria yangbaofengii]|uniref:wall-associated protein precursor n=1 Tax=Neisseria yangbaofengii TaxID=2709396 RepID=UPI001D0278BB|nr:wall-associated protein precursor [Neisseria yangbaofengii]